LPRGSDANAAHRVPKTPKSGAGLERNHLPLSAEITCRFRPKSAADFLRFLQAISALMAQNEEHWARLTQES
jgi:hypothetical protein